MRLTTFTDYTLRTLMYLAVQEGRLATIPDIAAAYGIAENHLNKVVHQLGLAGEVATLRGRGGVLRLARPAAAINLGAVIRRTERGMALVPCLATPAGSCAITPACRLRAALAEAVEAFLAVLDRYTLADLVVAPRRDLALLLGLPLAGPAFAAPPLPGPPLPVAEHTTAGRGRAERPLPPPRAKPRQQQGGQPPTRKARPAGPPQPG